MDLISGFVKDDKPKYSTDINSYVTVPHTYAGLSYSSLHSLPPC